ncbi:MAG: extracellular solute-binding protein [Phycisphaerales bacterium JB060]
MTAALPLCFVAACLAQTEHPGTSNQETTLRVALYPYVPDAGEDGFESMVARIETEFETANPGIRVEVVVPSYSTLDVYNPEAVLTALSQGTFDVIAIDTVILPSLADTGLLAPLDHGMLAPSTHEAAVQASTHHGQLFGVPYILCGNFVISRSKEVASAASADELVTALEAMPEHTINIVGDFTGSWTVPALYLDAFVDTYGAGSVAQPIPVTVDPHVMKALASVVDQADMNGRNPCREGVFDDDFAAPLVFALGYADSLFGFSERLHLVLKNDVVGDDIFVGSAPLGHGEHPVLYTDSFVFRQGMSTQVREAAEAFVTYMNDPSTVEWFMFSDDAKTETRPTPVPRYLLPARTDISSRPRFSQDPFYPTLFSEMSNAEPFPAEGMYMLRDKLRDAVNEALANTK